MDSILKFVGGTLLVIVGALAFVVLFAKPGEKWPFPVVQFVSGTEYNIGEAGQVIVEARFVNGSSAFVGSCLLSVWYPDKSLFVSQNGTTGSNGNQYIEFTVPDVTGVYEYQADCPLVTGDGVVSKSFHVSEFQNETTVKLLRRIKAVVPK